MSKDFEFFGEEDFLDKMNNVVLPFFRINMLEGEFKSFDGRSIHYYYLRNPEEKAAIVISHGFCEFNGKYHEMMYYFYQMGYSVFLPEHRGHGYSYRECQDKGKVYIDDFSTYVEDFHEFVQQIVIGQSVSGRLYLFAHSMGGAIGALYLEEHPQVFSRAILSSPMIRLKFGKYPMGLVRILMRIAEIAGWKKRYAPGQHGFDNIDVFESSSTMSKPRYDYVFHLRQVDGGYSTYGGTYGWVMAADRVTSRILKGASRIKVPVLLCQAGMDTLVEAEPQQHLAELSENIEFVRFDKSKHEIFNATEDVRLEYYSKLMEFFN